MLFISLEVLLFFLLLITPSHCFTAPSCFRSLLPTSQRLTYFRRPASSALPWPHAPFLHPLCTRIRPTYRSLHEHVILCHISFALTALAPVTLSTPYNFNPHSPLFPLPPFHFSHSQPSVPSLSSLLCPRRPQSPLAVDHILCSLRPPPLPRITPLSPRSPPALR